VTAVHPGGTGVPAAAAVGVQPSAPVPADTWTGADQEEVVRAITTVANGGAVFGAALARRVAEFFASGPPGPADVFPQLTAREREVLELVAAGRSNAQIAAALYLSPKTVRNNVSNVLSKLQVTDRAQAIVRAREAGLGR
jgi:DNA-binding NarL/FixJ family response regulator